MRKHMKNSVAETLEIAITISVSFKNLDLVVAALGETVGYMVIKGTENAGEPVRKRFSTFFKLRNVADRSFVNPILQ